MIILGLGGLQNDGACAVLKDGLIEAAIEESKLSRGARGGVPEAAVAECLRLTGVSRDAVDCVAVVRPSTRRCISRCGNCSRRRKSPS
jgi:predicted NodU family carbamoyl transferase